jgi:hypothetical protein
MYTKKDAETVKYMYYLTLREILGIGKHAIRDWLVKGERERKTKRQIHTLYHVSIE